MTVIVTENVPEACGVPEINANAPLTVRPAGSPVAVHVLVPLPPIALSDALYASPTIPPGSELVKIVSEIAGVGFSPFASCVFTECEMATGVMNCDASNTTFL